MKRLARFSSSAHSLYCGLWVPRSRAEPFFPLCPSWSTGTIHPQDAAPVPPSGIAGFASSGIIPGRLPHSDKPSPGFFFDNSPVVLFVELHIYNTVVLAARGESLGSLRKKIGGSTALIGRLRAWEWGDGR